jgi:hypothetical protein
VNNAGASSAQTRGVAQEEVQHSDNNSGNHGWWDFMFLRLYSPITTLAPVQINNNKDAPAGVNEGLKVIGVGVTKVERRDPTPLKKLWLSMLPLQSATTSMEPSVKPSPLCPSVFPSKILNEPK